MKMMSLSKRPNRYDKCVIKEGDALMVKNDESTAYFSVLPKIPVRIVLNDKTFSIFQDDQLKNLLTSFVLKYTTFSRVNEDPRCFIVSQAGVKKTQVCELTSSNRGDWIEEWDYDFNLFLQLLYAYYMTYSYFMKGEEKEITTKKISAQIQKCNQTLNSNISTMRFSSTCYGKQQSLIDIRKEMWNERPFRYRPGEQKTPRTGKSKSASNKKLNQK